MESSHWPINILILNQLELIKYRQFLLLSEFADFLLKHLTEPPIVKLVVRGLLKSYQLLVLVYELRSITQTLDDPTLSLFVVDEFGCLDLVHVSMALDGLHVIR